MERKIYAQNNSAQLPVQLILVGKACRADGRALIALRGDQWANGHMASLAGLF